MNLPPKYLEGLTPAQRVLQTRLIQQNKEYYERTGNVKDRPKVSSKETPRSSHVVMFESRYGFPITDLAKVKATFPNTDVDTILDKGAAAYASSGSRPNTGSFAWRYARLASVLTGGKALRVDKDLVGEADKKKILSKLMPFHLELGSNGEKYGGKAIVVNSMTGKHYSTKPIPMAKAKAQQRILEAATKKETK